MDITIQIVISILTILCSLLVTKIEFRNNINLHKENIKTEQTPYIISDIMNFMQGEVQEKQEQFVHSLSIQIIQFGSEKAMAIYELIRNDNYLNKLDNNCVNGMTTLSLCALLISQLRYDANNEIVKPDSILRTYIKDYDSCKADVAKSVNNAVSKLKLSRKFVV